MEFILLSLILMSLAASSAKVFTVDCSKYPGPCNNDCYAVFVANKHDTLHRDQNGDSEKKRQASGCLKSPNNPCRENGPMSRPKPDDSSCDEYPYASTHEGGDGAILRCTVSEENSLEGAQLGGWFNANCKDEPNCQFDVMFVNVGAAKYCQDKAGKNDGHEYVYEGNKKYKLQGSKFRRTAPGWKLHDPDPALLFPAHRRREFLLETGETSMLLSRDVDKSFDGASIYYEANNTMLQTRIVRELHGVEKSPMFRL